MFPSEQILSQQFQYFYKKNKVWDLPCTQIMFLWVTSPSPGRAKAYNLGKCTQNGCEFADLARLSQQVGTWAVCSAVRSEPAGIVRALYLFWNQPGVEIGGKASWPAVLARTLSDEQWPTDRGPPSAPRPWKKHRGLPGQPPPARVLHGAGPQAPPGEGLLRPLDSLGFPRRDVLGSAGGWSLLVIAWRGDALRALPANSAAAVPGGAHLGNRTDGQTRQRRDTQVLSFLATRHDVHCSERSGENAVHKERRRWPLYRCHRITWSFLFF